MVAYWIWYDTSIAALLTGFLNFDQRNERRDDLVGLDCPSAASETYSMYQNKCNLRVVM